MTDERAQDRDVLLQVTSERYSGNDAGWVRQVAELRRALQEAGIPLRREELPTEGMKAGTEVILVSLGSAGVITAAVEIFRLWLQRDRSRKIVLSVDQDGRRTNVTLDADSISDATAGEIVTAVARRQPND